MLQKIDPTKTLAWMNLEEHFQRMKNVQMKDLFEKDKKRFKKFSLIFEDILFDFSKNIISDETVNLFKQFIDDVGLHDAIEQQFSGKFINETENRAVLHTALRNRANNPILVNEKDVMPHINSALKKVEIFSNQLTSGQIKGFSGRTITDVVNIGIGGSDLGPKMVTEALKSYKKININTHFVANIDGSDIVDILKKLDVETTLFIIASKTFSTLETMTNAETAKKWFLLHAKDEKEVAKHFLAVTANKISAENFGIEPNNIFEVADWVGGRYSLWSSIGLSIACTIGYENFVELLEGAFAMDEHFRNEIFENNIPQILALISIWYLNFFGANSEAILPYDSYLHFLPNYLQQVNMESNGKNTNRDGKPIPYQTAPIIWGDIGTNSQHSFFQLLHQGSQLIPCDFIVPSITHNPIGDHHQKLLSNFFAQTEALMVGSKDGNNSFRKFSGNRPTNSILFNKITPRNLGSLIAMYEHKIFTQGIIWNIFSFDQFGVELGKELAKNILPELSEKTKSSKHDSSTNGLINYFKNINKTADNQHYFLQKIGSNRNLITLPTLPEIQINILRICQREALSSKKIAELLGKKQKSGNLKRALYALNKKKLLHYTIPEKPHSSFQKHKITKKGKDVLAFYEDKKKELLNRIQIIKGNITQIEVEAIVNAANNSLLGGGGVDGAIHRAAGNELLRECRLIGRCATGDAVITKAYLLPAKNIIHAVGPIWHGGSNNEDDLLAACYKSSLKIASENKLSTVAFPAISTGIYRFPFERATKIAIKIVKDFLENNTSIEKIIFVCYRDKTYEIYQNLLREN